MIGSAAVIPQGSGSMVLWFNKRAGYIMAVARPSDYLWRLVHARGDSPSLGLFAARESDLASLARRGHLSSGALELERYVELGAIGLYFSFGV